MQRLLALPWPGNVRELGNVMTRLAVTLPDGVRDVDVTLLEPSIGVGAVPRRPVEGVLIRPGTTLAEAERRLIDAALQANDYNRARAARQLGIGERTLRRKLNAR